MNNIFIDANILIRELREGKTLHATLIDFIVMIGVFITISCLFWIAMMVFHKFCSDLDGDIDDMNEKSEKLTREKILERISDVKLVVREEDLVDDADLEKGNESFENMTEEKPRFLSLPQCSSKNKSGNISGESDIVCETRKIPNCCSICLSAYDPGETVVW
eukprot:CAMPEP_0195508178 /NCGR_PEP_ID=MMETSP0794_2-20130614/1469_1 /TAXON_ID=515487 /ORGANISM="Stephanopyxis turris, Strain CCMP 815" /LENGTH=161 /DNA_ID=CAMNT_0040635083 /DNA_START=149 /DNA_END=631 /DNA_ORIENTATION=-